MTFVEIIILMIAGLMVRFINTLAGGATIISLSVLMFMGLPLSVANGTHRIAAAFQTITSVSTFRAKKVLEWKKGCALAIPVIIGSIAGARIAIEINEAIFEKIVAIVMVLIMFLILLKNVMTRSVGTRLRRAPSNIEVLNASGSLPRPTIIYCSGWRAIVSRADYF